MHTTTGRYSFSPPLSLAGDVELNPGPVTGPDAVAPPGELSIYHANVRSLKKQLGDLRACASVLERHDVVAISETWLNDTVADSELEIGFPEHTWFRRDRGSRGGGVACAVRSSLLPLRLPDPAGTECLLIRLRSVSVVVAVCYRPPDDDTVLGRMTDVLSNIQPQDCKLVVVGDFNLPELTWVAAADSAGAAIPILGRHTSRATRFIDASDGMGLKQWVAEPTRGDSTLDLVLTRRLPARVDVRDGVFISDHKETVATISVPRSRPPMPTRRTAYNYRRADFDGLRRSLSLIPWGLLDGVGVDEAVDTFYQLLESAIADHVPTVVLRRRVPPWFDGAVRAALRLKEAAYRRFRRNPSPSTRAEFADKRRDFKSVSNNKYFEYLRNLTDDFKTNPKRYWSFLKTVTNKSSVSSALFDACGQLVTDDRTRASVLNEAFAAKFTDPGVAELPDTVVYPVDVLSRICVSEAAVRKALLSVAPGKHIRQVSIKFRITARQPIADRLDTSSPPANRRPAAQATVAYDVTQRRSAL